MLKKLLNLFSKIKLLKFGVQHTHATHEYLIIKDDGATETFVVGTTSYGKNSNIPLSERKPETTIEYMKSK